jgi:hypothetical protein
VDETSLSLSLDEETFDHQYMSITSTWIHAPSVLDFFFLPLRLFTTPLGVFCAAIFDVGNVIGKVRDSGST